MTLIMPKIWNLIKRTEFAQLGYFDELGMPNIRNVWCIWHKGIQSHFISSNTSSAHVQALKNNNLSCLYFYDSNTFEGVCLQGEVVVHQEKNYKEMLWTEDSLKYYPGGVEDEDYSVLEFIAEKGSYYGGGNSYEISKQDIDNSQYGDTPIKYI